MTRVRQHDTTDDSGSGTFPPENARASRIGQRRPVTTEEQAHLAAGVGRILLEARTGAGLSGRQLGAAIGAAVSTVHYIETGKRRPRRSMLESLAQVLDPDGAQHLCDRLVAAAGYAVATSSPGGDRRRQRRGATAAKQRRRHLMQAAQLQRAADSFMEMTARNITLRYRGGPIPVSDHLGIRCELIKAEARADAMRAEAESIRRRLGVLPAEDDDPTHVSDRSRAKTRA